VVKPWARPHPIGAAFFGCALPQVRDPEVRALFSELRDEEARLHELVREDLAKIPLELEVSAEDFADEPVGH
jgi:hypothetical protein